MHESPLSLSTQQHDLQLFLDALQVELPPIDAALSDGYVLLALNAAAASLFEAKHNTAVLLAYRIRGTVFPLFIVFVRGDSEMLLCHSSLLLDAYAQGDDVAPRLRQATGEFFSRDMEQTLAALSPTWARLSPAGLCDCRIFWDTKPESKIVMDVFAKTLGTVCCIPLFPSVFFYNNAYEENLLEEALFRLEGCTDILVLGTGAGLEAICIALTYGIHVDATDINPVAVANTRAACRRTGTEHLVEAWVSDGFEHVGKAYDAILFEAPLATNNRQLTDPNRYDVDGTLLKEVFRGLAAHLKSGGCMYLMSRPDLTPYLPPEGLQWKVLRTFNAENSLAILKISHPEGMPSRDGADADALGKGVKMRGHSH